MIPQAAPSRRIARFRTDVQAAMDRVVGSQTYILGDEVSAFERAFAGFVGAGETIGVNSGTDALILALRAVGAGPGRDVVTTSMSASATGIAIALTGATTRFVDIDPATGCMDVRQLGAVVTGRTIAIVPVHLHGYPADIEAIVDFARPRGLFVIEDCAQAHGVRLGSKHVGTFGDVAAFSFYPTKNLGGIGDGGAVVTSNRALAEKIRSLRQYGWTDTPQVSALLGYNSRLDALQAAVLRCLLPRLDQGNQERRQIASIYREHLRPLEMAGLLRLPSDHAGAVYHQFAIRVDRRADVMARLASVGIGTGIHYAVPIHRQPVFQIDQQLELPATDAFARQTLSLPIQPEAVGNDAAHIAVGVAQALRS